MIIDLVCTVESVSVSVSVKTIDIEITFPITQVPAPSLCEEIKDCLGISPTGSTTKFLNERGQWLTPAGGGGVVL